MEGAGYGRRSVWDRAMFQAFDEVRPCLLVTQAGREAEELITGARITRDTLAAEITVAERRQHVGVQRHQCALIPIRRLALVALYSFAGTLIEIDWAAISGEGTDPRQAVGHHAER